MNILTLSIKQKYFDEILAGKKTHEYREIRPTNAKKYITYLCGGKEYPADAELPEEGEAELKPIKYDAIKLLTGAYTGKRPYIIVEVKNAEAVILTDENGNDIVYEYQGEEYGEAYLIIKKNYVMILFTNIKAKNILPHKWIILWVRY